MGRLSVLLTVLAGSISVPLCAQEPTAFVPFAPRAYRLVNSVAFSPDDQTMYLALLHREVLEHRGVPDSTAPETALYVSHRQGEEWSEPELLPISGQYDDYEPTITSDGSMMVFNSTRPYADGRMPDINDLWMSLREGDEWGEPRRIEALTTFENEESYGSLMADGSLVFLRGRPDDSGQAHFDLYHSRFIDGQHSAPERHPVSTDRWGEGDPWVAPDGSYLIFTRWDDAVGWRESVDLYISFNIDGTWGPPQAMETLNTDGPDYGAAVSSDGRWLFYRADARFLRVPLEPVLAEYRRRQVP